MCIAVEHHRLDPIAGQNVGATETCGASANNRYPFAGRRDLRQIGPPAGFQRLVSDVFLNRADGDRAEAVIQRAVAFAQAVLRTNPPADFRQ